VFKSELFQVLKQRIDEWRPSNTKSGADTPLKRGS
jgi:hypothetical protein